MTAAVPQQTPHRHRNISFAVTVFCCIAFFSSAASAAISWKRVGTVTTLTNNQMCYTDGTNVVCDSSAPTLLGGSVGIGTTSPYETLTVGGLATTGKAVINNASGQGAFTDTNSMFGLTSASDTYTQMEFWQSGQASALIGHKPDDPNFYITNNYSSVGLGSAAYSITLTKTGNVGIGTTSPATLLHVNGVETVGLNGGTGGQITFNGATSGSVALQVAAAAGAGTAFQLPATNGTNTYVLQTNGSGVTSWVAGVSSFTGLTTGDLCTATSGTAIACASTLSGDVTSAGGTATVTTVAKIQGTTVSGTTGTTNVVFSASPTLTGTITAANLTLSGTDTNSFGASYSTTGTHADVALNTASAFRYTGAGLGTIQGILAGASGQVLSLHNDSASTLTLSNLSGSEATAANQIITGTGTDIVLPANSAVTLQYDATANGASGAWRATGSSNAANTSLSGLTAATTTNTIDNTTLAQTWTWNTLTTQNALTLSSTGETSGSLLTLTGANTGVTGPVLNVSTTSTGGGTAVKGVASGATGTNYGVYGSSGSSTGSGGYFTNTGTGYALITGTGNVGIGTTSPGYTLDVNGTANFRSSIIQSGGYALLGNYNSGGTYPSLGASLAIGNNFSTGNAELNIWNTVNPSTFVNTGIRFMQQTGTSSYTDIMFLKNNGNVGIGTTSPTSLLHTYEAAAKTATYTSALIDALDTSSTASVNKVGMDIESTGTWNGTNAVNTGLIVNATGGTTNYAATFSGGNVGIGTTNPVGALTVNSTSLNSLSVGVNSDAAHAVAQISKSLSVVASSASNSSIVGAVAFDYYNAGVSPSWSGALLTYNGTSVAGSTYGVTTANTGQLIFQNVSNAVIATNGGTDIYISPNNAVSTVFKASGSVGIGTTSPRGLLDVTSGSSNTGTTVGAVSITAPNLAISSSYGTLTLQSNDTEAADMGGSIALGARYGSSPISGATNFAIIKAGKTNGTLDDYSGYLSFSTRLTGGSNLERMRIDNNGNVGIGTTSPATGMKVDINGPVKVAGTGSEACTASTVGAMRYNATGNYLEICSYP
jgi:hypothetical protein